MKPVEIVRILTGVANEYSREMVPGQVADIQRIAFHIGVTLRAKKQKHPSDLVICDIGGGTGLFSIGCAAAGFKRSVLIDDFNDSVNHLIGNSALVLHRKYGVEIISRDAVRKGIRDINGMFDIITTFDSMEHWHNSPKKLFQEVMTKLKPGGVFVLGVPNCVNLRKRLSVPFGYGKWSLMQHWYEEEVFRGHVREPDVSDLKYIARDMDLHDTQILGRNWLGYSSRKLCIRAAAKLFDYPLRLVPSMCSDIYLIGSKST